MSFKIYDLEVKQDSPKYLKLEYGFFGEVILVVADEYGNKIDSGTLLKITANGGLYLYTKIGSQNKAIKESFLLDDDGSLKLTIT